MKINNPSRRFEYILQSDREAQSPTVFCLRRLTWEELGDYQMASPVNLDRAIEVARIAQAAQAQARELTSEEVERLSELVPNTTEFMKKITAAYVVALRFGLVEIRGLQDENNQPLELSVPDFLRAAPSAVIHELGQELMQMSRLAEVERKNSFAPRVPGRAAGAAASARARRRSRGTAQ
jgi:hypothetical protein